MKFDETRVHVVLAIGVLSIAVWIRFGDLSARSVWFDEAFSLELATNCTFTELLDRTGRDVHPPLYYLSLKLWMLFAPRTEFGIRSLSAVFGVLGIMQLYACVRYVAQHSRISGISGQPGWIALASAALLAVNAQHVYWSREARMYTLGVLLAISSSLFLLKWLTAGSRIHAIAYVTSAAALMLTHNYGLFTVAAQVGFVGWIFWFPGAIQASTCGNAAVLLLRRLTLPLAAVWLYWPWLTVLLQQRIRVRTNFWIPEFRWRTLGDAIYLHVFSLNDSGIIQDRLMMVTCGVVILLAMAVTAASLVKKSWIRDVWSIMVVLGLGPLLVAATVSIVSVSVVDTRHLSFCFPFLIALFSGAFCALLNKSARAWIMIFSAAWMLFGTLQHRDSLQTDRRGGIREAVATLQPQLDADEVIVVQHPCIFHSVAFYLPDRNRLKLYLPAGLPRHYFGRPILRDQDLISASDLRNLNQKRIIALNTDGFFGDQTFPLPDVWQPSTGYEQTHRDVAAFQRSISVREYLRSTPEKTGPDQAVSLKLRNIANTSEFSNAFLDDAFNNQWFALSADELVSRSVQLSPQGLCFKTLPESYSYPRNLLFRGDVTGDFTVHSEWTVPGICPHDDAMLELLIEPQSESSVIRLQVSVLEQGNVLEMRVGASLRRLQLPPESGTTLAFSLSAERIGQQLTCRLTACGREVECRLVMNDALIRIGIGDAKNVDDRVWTGASAPESGPLIDSVLSEERPGATGAVTAQQTECSSDFYLQQFSLKAAQIRYDHENGVNDITVPPTGRFWMIWLLAGCGGLVLHRCVLSADQKHGPLSSLEVD